MVKYFTEENLLHSAHSLFETLIMCEEIASKIVNISALGFSGNFKQKSPLIEKAFLFMV